MQGVRNNAPTFRGLKSLNVSVFRLKFWPRLSCCEQAAVADPTVALACA